MGKKYWGVKVANKEFIDKKTKEREKNKQMHGQGHSVVIARDEGR